MMRARIIALIAITVFSIIGEGGYAVAIASLDIYTSKIDYEYGDLLSIIIKTSQITGKSLTLQIRDQNGTKSTPIVIQIVNTTTTITAREPFDSTIYKLGKYYLDAEYSGINASTSFIIIDSNKIIIPSWVKNLGGWWSKNLVTDNDFARGIEYLIQQKIIKIPDTELLDKTKDNTIPQWVKINAGWWANDLISDSEFALGIEYLIKIGLIVV